MVIERVHGLQATCMSLNDRFTILASVPPIRHVAKQRRASAGGFNIGNRNLVDQIAQAKRRAVQQRLGLRRFGSESSLPGLMRSNSFSNLSQRSVKTRIPWRQFNGSLSRSASFTHLTQSVWRGRGYKRRGGRMGLMRGKMRGRGGRQQVVGRMRGPRGRRGALRPRAGPPRVGLPTAGLPRVGPPRAGAAVRAGGRGRGRGERGQGEPGRGRGQGRGGTTRQQKPPLSKEELDLQLDQYMASTKSALDKELDAYMKNAMELE